MKNTGMRQRPAVQQKTALKRIIVLTSSVVTVLSVCLILFINFSDSRQAFAAPVLGDYRTTGSGDWNNASTWERFDGSNWLAATVAPTTADNIITVVNGHTVTINANTTIDQTVVEAGGFLVVNDAIVLTVANATGNDLDVFGTVKNAGVITQNGGSIIFENTGKYQHNFTTTPGTIPSSTWNSGSTCEIIGYTTNPEAPGGLQNFSNFIWNCPQQSDAINLNAGITNLSGDLNIMNTGSGELDWAASAVNCTIAGNLIINGGNFVYNKSSATTSLTVNGDYVQSGGSMTISEATYSAPNFNINGTFILTGGNANFVKGLGSTCTVSLSSDFTITGGTISTPSVQTSAVKFSFKKPGRQYFTASGYTISGNADYIVNAGSTLDLGTSVLQGRNFTLASYAGLISGSPDGIAQSGSVGNIQVTGIRSLSSFADYEYASNVAQVTGNGIPTTVRNLTITNSSNITLSKSVSVNGILTLASGNIITGANEVFVKNTSTSSIAGYSSSAYIDGNLRRSVSSTGTYDFPVGKTTHYEFISISLSAFVGVSDIKTCFSLTDPLANSTLNNVLVKGVSMTKMLPCGYWTVTPDAPIQSGNYSISVTERGQTNLTNGATFALLNRQSSQSNWTSEGVHVSGNQVVNAGAVTAVRSSVNVFGDFAIGYGDYLQLQNPTLISGIDLQVNSVYLFPEICSNVDAWVQLTETSGGATLLDIDDQSACYSEAWQPVIQFAANTTSFLKWNVTFKVAGTSTDTVLPQVALAAINVDGAQNVKEFVNANIPYSYATTPSSTLTISSEDGWYKATSTSSAEACDTADHESIFQLNYKNVRAFQFVTGLKNTTSAKVKRSASIYFKTLLNGNSGIPVRLIYFTAGLENGSVNLKWATASEENVDYFTVERSSDGETFTALKSQKSIGNSNSILYYQEADGDPAPGINYYRLRETDKNARFSFSEIQPVSNSDMVANSVDIVNLNPNPFSETFSMDFKCNRNEGVNISLVNTSGKQVYRTQFTAIKGLNNFKSTNLSYLVKGAYIVVVSDEMGQTSKRLIKN
jgi:hypothetical protein